MTKCNIEDCDAEAVYELHIDVATKTGGMKMLGKPPKMGVVKAMAVSPICEEHAHLAPEYGYQVYELREL